MELLFERFLSEERGEWPDIDLDLPSGDQREKVIQYVYRRYGERGAAMTANVITYRDRSATREVAKVSATRPSRSTGSRSSSAAGATTCARGDAKSFAAELAAAGFDPRGAADAALRRACGRASTTCRATSGSTRAAW